MLFKCLDFIACFPLNLSFSPFFLNPLYHLDAKVLTSYTWKENKPTYFQEQRTLGFVNLSQSKGKKKKKVAQGPPCGLASSSEDALQVVWSGDSLTKAELFFSFGHAARLTGS